MLMIRLSRVGKKKYPTYKIIIQEKSKDPWAKALEFLGHYNPHTKELKVKQERIEHWLSVGAKMSATVNNLLIKKGVIKGEKMKAAKLNKKQSASAKAAADKKEKKESSPPEGDLPLGDHVSGSGEEKMKEAKPAEVAAKTDDKELKGDKASEGKNKELKNGETEKLKEEVKNKELEKI